VLVFAIEVGVAGRAKDTYWAGHGKGKSDTLFGWRCVRLPLCPYPTVNDVLAPIGPALLLSFIMVFLQAVVAALVSEAGVPLGITDIKGNTALHW